MLSTSFRKIILGLMILVSFQAYGQTINNIVITGNERVENDTIKIYVDITPGVNFNNEQLDISIKKLYASNLFQKVSITVKGSTLYIKVIENPKLNLVVFEGNSKVKTKDLEAEIMMKPRGVYTKAKVQEDVNHIIDLYSKSGRFSVKVIPQIIILPQNRVDLIYKIKEGPTALIGKINFVGNHAFSDNSLRAELSSKEARWYRFLSSSDHFNPNRIEYDRELLIRFYQSKGYADFKIISVITNISDKKERFYITYTIDEGAKFDFGEMNLKSRLKSSSLDLKKLKQDIVSKTGDLYDVRKVERSVDLMTKQINDQGFAFVDIAPEVNLNEEKKLVNITYHIGESRRIYINQINIKGNVRTSDKVIRREFTLSEGDPYSATKIQRSERGINELDFFEPTNIETTRTNQGDKVDLDVTVQEKSTSNLTFAGGYDTSSGVVGRVGFSEANLFGNGQQLDVNYSQSKDVSGASLGFTEPYMFGRPVSGGFDLYFSKTASSTSQKREFEEKTKGFKLRSGYAVTENLRHILYYSLASKNVYNVSETASTFVKDQAGVHLNSMIGHELVYDRRDSGINPTSGYILTGDQAYAGLGGNTYFFRQTVGGRYYYPIINEDLVMVIAASAGYIKGLQGQNVSLVDRFQLGGAGSIRGFEPGGIGPRDKNNSDTIGGTVFYSTTAEVKFPLGIGKEMGAFGAAFIDAGTLYKADVPVDQKANIWDTDVIRASYGVGLGFVTPMGPIRLNYALPIKKAKYDQTKEFDIEFKTMF